ncbi:hypothetical protein GGI15_000987 [Coemansia interrupta]|uniref:Cullin family profile domain-containing protein n=1 Tax=Coemansia interrupta TaxID=1126814 RepID=A0A9W8HR30_9FUNG|nr:hypothetical protein GGI15_000987 [Coemansia interrupta]
MWATKRSGSTIGGGPQKKLVVKGLRPVPALPATYKENTLSRLQSAVRAIQTSQPTSQGLEELYRDCESLCLHKFGSEIYEMLQAELESYTRRQLSEINSQAADSTTNQTVLGQAQRFWTGYIQQLDLIRCVFLYLDRTYVLQTANVLSLWAMGLNTVKRYLVETDMKSRLIRLVIGEITKERDSKVVDRVTISALVNMFIELGLYVPFFMPGFIESTREYYQRESRRMVRGLVPVIAPDHMQIDEPLSGAMDVPRYLLHVSSRLEQESERIDSYLYADSKTVLLATVRMEMVEKHADLLLSSSFDAMADADMLADLSRLYTLLAAVNRLDSLKKVWASYIKKTGLRLVQAPDLDVNLVTRLLTLKQRLDDILRESFQNNTMLVNALREAFGEFINTRRNKPAQLLAKFIDQRMRTSSKSASTEDEMDELLDRVLVLFRFIQGKDMFEAYYKRDLAKRLLYNKSASIDTEKSMLQKLKSECGAGFTNRLEGMHRDMEVSEELATTFAEARASKDQDAINFHPTVLTLAFWPNYDQIQLVVPRQVDDAQEEFVEFYSAKHQSRNLQWQHNLGTCLLKVTFDEGVKELQLSIVQGTIMLLFTEEDELDYMRIQQMTGLEDVELKRALQSLACGKYRVLTKDPKSRDVASTDRFSFNSQFKCPLARVRISQIAVKEDDKEDRGVEEHVHQDRMVSIDAALIRIMKARRSLEHSALVTELMGQLRFNTSTSDVKERLETMIEREYILRDDNNHMLYHYIA